jgi:spore coat protein U-like protein
MPVQAQVNANCNFTSSNTMDFLSYDTIAAGALGGTVGVTVRCTKGASVSIGIDTGAHAGAVVGSTRAMANGANSLGYDFYQNATYTTLWTTSGLGLYSYVAADNSPATVTIYGRVPAGQDVPAGTYQDTVQVTVNY